MDFKNEARKLTLDEGLDYFSDEFYKFYEDFIKDNPIDKNKKK